MESSKLNSTSKIEIGYSIRKVLASPCNIFNERLKSIVKGDTTDKSPLQLGNPSEILLQTGMSDSPIELSIQKLNEKRVQSNHPFTLLSVFSMHDFLGDPIAVFQSKTHGNCKVVLTEMEAIGVNLLVAIEMGKICGNRIVNSVRSIYPKDIFYVILKWIVEDNLHEYIHKQKILNWLSKQPSNPAEVANLIKVTTKLVELM